MVTKLKMNPVKYLLLPHPNFSKPETEANPAKTRTQTPIDTTSFKTGNKVNLIPSSFNKSSSELCVGKPSSDDSSNAISLILIGGKPTIEKPRAVNEEPKINHNDISIAHNNSKNMVNEIKKLPAQPKIRDIILTGDRVLDIENSKEVLDLPHDENILHSDFMTIDNTSLLDNFSLKDFVLTSTFEGIQNESKPSSCIYSITEQHADHTKSESLDTNISQLINEASQDLITEPPTKHSLPFHLSLDIQSQSNISNFQTDSDDLTITPLPNFLELEDASPISDFLGQSPHESNPDSNSLLLKPSEFRQQKQNSIHQLFEKYDTNVEAVSTNEQGKPTTILLNNYDNQPLYLFSTVEANGTSTQSSLSQPQFFVLKTTNNNSPLEPQEGSSEPRQEQHDTSGLFLIPVEKDPPKGPVQKERAESVKKIFKCEEPGCGKSFKKASKLRVHMMLHTGERPFKCNVIGCEWAFTTSHKLKRHMESHEGRKDFICDYPGCGNRFTTIYNLNTHKKLHSRPCIIQCPEHHCDQKFPTKKQLELHLRSVHRYEDKTVKCPEPGCEKVFFSSSCLGSHMKAHQQKPEDLKCKYPNCGKVFTKACRMRQHEHLHSGEKPFLCKFAGCSWAFPTMSKLKRHMTKHTNYRKWVCDVCQKTFLRSEHLKGHLITHTGKKPFVCPVEDCGMSFTAKSSLYVHLKKHNDSGKTIAFHCPVKKCDKFYSSKHSLRQHIILKHSDQPLNENDGKVNWLKQLSVLSVVTSLPTSENVDQLAPVDPQLQANDNLQGNDAQADDLLATDFLAQDVEQSFTSYTDANQNSESFSSQLLNPASLESSASIIVSAPSTHSHAATAQSQSVFDKPQAQPTNGYTNHSSSLIIDGQPDQFFNQLQNGDTLKRRDGLFLGTPRQEKKSSVVFWNMSGSARTDSRSNSFISEKSIKRWQKQKEEEAAKLRLRLEASKESSMIYHTQNTNQTSEKGLKKITINVSNNASQTMVQALLMAASNNRDASIQGEIPDMELRADGLSIPTLDASSSNIDAFMPGLFIQDNESNIIHQRAQSLLEDDPGNPEQELLSNMEGMESGHHVMGLDVHLDENSLMSSSLEFQGLE